MRFIDIFLTIIWLGSVAMAITCGILYRKETDKAKKAGLLAGTIIGAVYAGGRLLYKFMYGSSNGSGNRSGGNGSRNHAIVSKEAELIKALSTES
jgi:hypothetical protein